MRCHDLTLSSNEEVIFRHATKYPPLCWRLDSAHRHQAGEVVFWPREGAWRALL